MFKISVSFIDAMRIVARHDHFSDELTDAVIAAVTDHIEKLEQDVARLTKEIEALKDMPVGPTHKASIYKEENED